MLINKLYIAEASELCRVETIWLGFENALVLNDLLIDLNLGEKLIFHEKGGSK